MPIRRPQPPQPQAVQQNGAIKPAARPQSAPAGSSRSARWKAKAKPSSGSISPAPGQRPAQQGRSLHRAGRRQGQPHAVPRPLRRPRARSGRSGLPHAQARRHFLHYRSQLIVICRLKLQSRRRKRRLCCFRAHSRDRRSHGRRPIGPTKTSRQEFAVKFSGMKDRPRRTTAGDTGPQTENDTEAALGL